MWRPIAIAGLCLVGAAVLAGAATGPLMSRVENPPYTVVRTEGPIELRDYPTMNVASVVVGGTRGAAIQKGFRTLADYIFGANDGARKIEMTAPVMQGRDPVQGPESEAKSIGDQTASWTVRFVMPRALQMGSLPKPRDPLVRLETIPPATFAAIRFSGFWRNALLMQKTEELETFLVDQKLKPRGRPIFAFYNPPWTLPFLRRNEVMIEIER